MNRFILVVAFCHLKPQMSQAYIRALSSKMKNGDNGFLQFGDFDKYSACLERPEQSYQFRSEWGTPARVSRSTRRGLRTLSRQPSISSTPPSSSRSQRVASVRRSGHSAVNGDSSLDTRRCNRRGLSSRQQ
jgi:hypothetical protein